MPLLAFMVGALLGASTHHLEIVHVLPQPRVAPYLEVACEIAGGICPAEPEVVFTPTRVGVMGFHWAGTDVVFITDRCLYSSYEDTMACRGIIVHEMVHYVVGQQGRYTDDVCSNEQLAWSAYNHYVMTHGRHDLVNLEWRLAYPDCK